MFVSTECLGFRLRKDRYRVDCSWVRRRNSRLKALSREFGLGHPDFAISENSSKPSSYYLLSEVEVRMKRNSPVCTAISQGLRREQTPSSIIHLWRSRWKTNEALRTFQDAAGSAADPRTTVACAPSPAQRTILRTCGTCSGVLALLKDLLSTDD